MKLHLSVKDFCELAMEKYRQEISDDEYLATVKLFADGTLLAVAYDYFRSRKDDFICYNFVRQEAERFIEQRLQLLSIEDLESIILNDYGQYSKLAAGVLVGKRKGVRIDIDKAFADYKAMLPEAELSKEANARIMDNIIAYKQRVV